MPTDLPRIAVNDRSLTVIIPCCIGDAVAIAGVRSVLRHTPAPANVIVVDNGSSDRLRALTDAIGDPSSDRLTIHRLDENLGFSAACNRALSLTRSDRIVFMHDDVVVAAGWLDGLSAPLDADGTIGMVGAVSHHAAGAQRVHCSALATQGEFESFAQRRRTRFAGRWFFTTRLSKIALLVRRDVLDTVGGWDERFGLGYYEDDDLCLRASRAGYRLAVAPDVFVHHHGSKTFRALGIDVRQQLTTNREIFQRKWAHSGVPAATKPRTSIVMIVKNEEARLADCLESIDGLADEIVVVDTGSTDRTREIAQQFRTNLFDFPWTNSFSDARNEAIRRARGDWLFLVDADDRVDAGNYAKLRSLLANLNDENIAHVVKIRSKVDPRGYTQRLLDQVRIWRNHPQVRFEYRVHEQILPSIARAGGSARWTDIVIHHTGYQHLSDRRRKLERNLQLLTLERQERPADAFTLFNLGRTLRDLDRMDEAIALFHESLAAASPDMSIVRKLYSLLASAYQSREQWDRASEICREGLVRYPNDTELLYQESILSRRAGRLEDAEACLMTLMQQAPTQCFDMVDVGVRSFKASHQLALVRVAQGRPGEAEACWEKALSERPDHVPSLLGVSELFLEQGRWNHVESVAARLASLSPGEFPMAATILRARASLRKNEVENARSLLEGACAAVPHALLPKELLCDLLLEGDRDLPRAEALLRQILQAKPGHEQAQQKLARIASPGAKPGAKTAPCA